jgi:hypothetical protein
MHFLSSGGFTPAPYPRILALLAQGTIEVYFESSQKSEGIQDIRANQCH